MRNTGWFTIVFIVLAAEKTFQHAVVTLAFYFDWQRIRSTVAVDPNWLMVGGAAIGLLFALSLWAIWNGRRWAVDLLIVLALLDIVGEFVAQGKLSILITFSFLVAIVLLCVSLAYRRKWTLLTSAK